MDLPSRARRGGVAAKGGRLVAMWLELRGASGRWEGDVPSRQSIRDGEGHGARTSSREKALGQETGPSVRGGSDRSSKNDGQATRRK